ncbi:MAG: HNH endonuclease, partial [Patescibacteria group bacterium]|nr:HNH endonuclease [Patescibacteria group bacterium]
MTITPIDHGAETAKAHGLKRSDQWPEVERAYRAAHPTCAACPSTAVQVHHVLPFHFAVLLARPDLELDPRNLIGLCEKEHGDEGAQDHHLLLGHLDDFQSYNPDVRKSVTFYSGDVEAAIRASAAWQAAMRNKPKAWVDMTSQDKADMRALMDALYPLTKKETEPMAERTATGKFAPASEDAAE